MKKIIFLLTVVTTMLQAQTYTANVSLVSTTSDNYYLTSLVDTYYPCDDDGSVSTTKQVFQITKASSGGFTLTSYKWENKTWVKTGESVDFNTTNIGKTYFFEFSNPKGGYLTSAYTLNNQYLYEYPLSESYIGRYKTFYSNNEYRSFIENNLSYSSLFNKPIRYKKFSAHQNSESNRKALGVAAGLFLLGAIIFGGDSGSNSNSTNQYQNTERKAYDWDKNGVPIYGPSIREGGYDSNGKKISNW